MKGRLAKAPTTLGVIGAMLLLLVLISGGISGAVTPKISTAAELADCGSHGGGIYRPFAEVEFDEVTFSGLYLTEERSGSDRVAAWIMWGSNGDTTVCFYVKADGRDLDGNGSFDDGDAPPDEENVSYILRAAQPSYDEHSQWALDESVSDVAAYFADYGVSEDDIRGMFAPTVLEASRQGRIIARVGLGAGVLLLAAGIAWAIIDRKRRVDDEDEPEENREFYVPPETEDTEDDLLMAEVLEDDEDEMDDEALNEEALAASDENEDDEVEDEDV